MGPFAWWLLPAACFALVGLAVATGSPVLGLSGAICGIVWLSLRSRWEAP